MDEFDAPIRQSPGGLSPVLASLFFGAVLGGGLGIQGRSLQALAADLQQVLSDPALGGQAVSRPAWAKPEAAAARQADLDSDLTSPWPADRIMIAPEPAPAQAKAAAAPAQELSVPQKPAPAADWRRHLIAGVEGVLPQSARSSAFLAAALQESSPRAVVAAAARPQAAPAAHTSARAIDYGLEARGAVLASGGGSAMNLMGRGR